MNRRRSRAAAAALCVSLSLVLSACTVDWAEWGRGVERQGSTDSELTISPSNAARLQHKWSIDLGAYINASPVLASGIEVDGTNIDLLYVGTEHGDFFAVNTAGEVVWSRALGSQVIDCPDTPDKVFGVSASALFDRSRNSVYVAGGDGYVYSLDPATGATRWRTQLTSLPGTEVVFSAPTLLGNHLYFEIASHCDIIPYHGRVVDINTDTHAVAHAWYATGATGPDGGGIWGWGGASVDPVNGDVYVATGNSRGEPENAFWADSVVRLSANLDLKAFHKPGVEIRDDDFGSTPVLFQKPGCPPQLVVEQKNGSVYLYDRDSIAAGYKQNVRVIDPPDPTPGAHEPGLLGVALYYPKTQMVYVITPRDKVDGTFKRGVVAFTINSDCRLVPAWQTPFITGIAATATIANNVLYATGGGAGKVYAFNATTGAPLWNSGTSTTGAFFAAPIVVAGKLYAVGYDRRLHAWGL
jgi:outer membrane protein assembly factor BamB